MTECGGEAAVVVRRPLSPRKFFAMLYETDATEVRRPTVVQHLHEEFANATVPYATAVAVPANVLRQTAVVVVRPTATAAAAAAAAYVERTFAAGLTAFREYTHTHTHTAHFRVTHSAVYFPTFRSDIIIAICTAE